MPKIARIILSLLAVLGATLTPQISPARAADPACPKVFISEVLANVANESSDEVLEIYNAGEEALDLTGWQLVDDGATPLTLTAYPRPLSIGLSQTILAAGGFALILDKDYAGVYDTAIQEAIPDPEDLSLLSSTSGNLLLANTADRVALRSPEGAICDELRWMSDGGEGTSLARQENSDGSLSAAALDPTGHSLGFIREQVVVEMPAPPTLRISELLPDPAGDDSAEFIEIENSGVEPALLTNVELRDASTSQYQLE